MKLADALRKAGAGKGDVVSIISENCLEYIIPLLATLYNGSSANLVNPHYKKCRQLLPPQSNPSITPTYFQTFTVELSHAFGITKPKIVFCSSKMINAVRDLRKEIGSVDMVVVMGEDDCNLSMGDLIERSSQDPQSFKLTDVNLVEDVALILMSSGTTGLPKAVMLSYQSTGCCIQLA